MEIIITGKQGEGKTTLARKISKLLEEDGMKCTIQDGEFGCRDDDITLGLKVVIKTQQIVK